MFAAIRHFRDAGHNVTWRVCQPRRSPNEVMSSFILELRT